MQSEQLTRLAGQAEVKSRYTPEEETGIRTQAKQFEAMLVKMMVDSMRKNVPEDELFEDSSDPSRGIYQGMLDGEYAQLLSNKESFGLAESMMRQFGVEPGPTDTTRSAPLHDDRLLDAPREFVPRACSARPFPAPSPRPSACAPIR